MRRALVTGLLVTALGIASTATTAAVTATAAAAATACSSGYVALTFDDGPSGDPTRTLAILDTLKNKGAKATFFLVGQEIVKYPATPRRAVAEGNRLGNHTYTHTDLTYLSASQIAWEFSATNNAMAAAGLPRPTLQRPPYGHTNSVVEAEGNKLGLTQVLWNIDTVDYANPSAEWMRAKVRAEVRPNSIIVILMHDAGVPNNTAAALPGMIDDLRGMGYCFAFIERSDRYEPSGERGVGWVKLVPVDGGTNTDPTAPVVVAPQEPKPPKSKGNGKGPK
jgi:peptidoglycan/xylan/chitin deacetylase (PgdA/CDA1 family)